MKNACVTTSQLTSDEREVHLSLDEITNQWVAEVSISKYITKFRKAGWREIRRLDYPDGRPAIVWFAAPDFALSFRKPIKRQMSEEQRKASAARIRAVAGTKSIT